MDLPDVEAHITGTVWKIEAEPGKRVDAGQAVVVIETMKMETIIPATYAGIVRELRCQPGRMWSRSRPPNWQARVT